MAYPSADLSVGTCHEIRMRRVFRTIPNIWPPGDGKAVHERTENDTEKVERTSYKEIN